MLMEVSKFKVRPIPQSRSCPQASMPDVKRRKVRHGCVLFDGKQPVLPFVGWVKFGEYKVVFHTFLSWFIPFYT